MIIIQLQNILSLIQSFYLFLFVMLENSEIDMFCKIGCKIRRERTRLKFSQARLAFEIKSDGRSEE